MSDYITIRSAAGTWTVRAAGAVLAETENALELTEGDYPPVIYFPRGDVSMAFFDQSDTLSTCPHKGSATHYNFVAKSGTFENVAWSYEDPKDDISGIKGYLAFYPNKVAIEQI